MRRDIKFKDSDGITLRGWHYLPEGASGKVPTVIMAHGFSGTKEIFLDRYAELFAKSGIASIVYDHRNFGASDGEPRQEVDPWQQVKGYRDAITFAETLPETNVDRIGVFGSSYSGGHVLVVGAIDRRVKCVVSQVPLVDGPRNAQRAVPAPQLKGMRAAFDADRRARFAGKPPGRLPVVSNDGSPSALPTADSYEFMIDVAGTHTKTWINEVTVRSIEMFTEYNPGSFISLVSPTPLLMIVALDDHLAIADLALEAYANAREPKRLLTLQGGHFEPYVKQFERSGGGANAWFVEHLLK